MPGLLLFLSSNNLQVHATLLGIPGNTWEVGFLHSSNIPQSRFQCIFAYSFIRCVTFNHLWHIFLETSWEKLGLLASKTIL